MQTFCDGIAGSTIRPDLPWAASDAQLQQLRERLAAMRNDPNSCLYTGLASVDFEKAFGGTGALKTSEYILMAGPVGKYILQGVFHEEQQRVVFRFASGVSLSWIPAGMRMSGIAIMFLT